MPHSILTHLFSSDKSFPVLLAFLSWLVKDVVLISVVAALNIYFNPGLLFFLWRVE